MLSGSTVMRSVSVLLIAAATGHSMQNGGALASKFGMEQEFKPASDLTTGVSLPSLAFSQPASLPQAPASLPGRIASLAMLSGPAIQDDLDHTPFEFACAPEAMIVPLPKAEIAVSLTSACHPNQHVIVEQDGLLFSALTNAQGVAAFIMPALSARPVVSMTFPDGSVQRAGTQVDDADTYSHTVLQWQGHDDISLHVFESDASIKEARHLTAASKAAQNVHGPRGGRVAQFGSDVGESSRYSQVYSFPKGPGDQNLATTFEVVAEVTEMTCGTDLFSKGMRFEQGHQVNAIDLMVSMPDCDAVGQAVVLPDPFSVRLLASK